MKIILLIAIFVTSMLASIETQNKRLNTVSELLTQKYAKDALSTLVKPESSNTLTKSEFETKGEFITRREEAEIKNIQYKQDVNKIMATAQLKALSAVLPSIYGEIKLTNLHYLAEKKSFIATVSFSKIDIKDTISINIPSKEARTFKTNLKTVKALPVFDIEGNKVHVDGIKFLHNDKKYIGSFTNEYFKVSQPTLSISKNYIQIEQENSDKQEQYMLANKLFDNDLERALKKSPKVEQSSKKWAFVIGVEDYVFTEKITYAKRSAELYAKVLTKTQGVPRNHITLLLNERATGNIIKNSLKSMLRKVKEGDTIYFYYNGHGIPVPSEKNEPYMLASDMSVEFVQDDKFFALKNVYKMLTDSKADNVVAVVDSCFTGATDGKVLLKGVAAARLIPKKVGFNQEKMSIITAGQKRQYSNGYDKKGHRLFSYYVMKDLIGGKADMSALYNSVYNQTKNTSFELYGDLRVQEPSIDGNLKLELN